MAASRGRATTSETPTGVSQGSIDQRLSLEVKKLQEIRRDLPAKYKAEKKVKVSGSPMFQPYFGKQMPIIVNGIAVYVPLDGNQYEIPATFAGIFHQRIKAVNDHISLRTKMSDVRGNLERYAGEKSLISRG